MSPALVVLAAGMGSRYGGLKQIDPVGPAGETVLDYAVFDALRAGFGRVVFVIRRDFEALFREKIGARYANRVGVDYVFQSLDALPPNFTVPAGREKPWGTGHALWCARDALRENFAVINADDFYGRDAFQELAGFLKTAQGGEIAMIGFKLANTLSEHGAVSRGVTSLRPDGTLQSIVEETGIKPEEVGPGRKFSGEEFVSMNCWAFTPDVFPKLDAQWREFLAGLGHPPGALKAEFYLPAAVSTMVARKEAAVRVIPTRGNWFGVTYRDDRPRVQAAIQGLVAAGEYPENLWR
jgi:NDP-sugar pyrophosphorylase family protein